MAYSARHAKAGKDWSLGELVAYNIQIVSQSPGQFFGAAAANTSLAELDPLIITGSIDTENLSDTTLRYLTYLDLAARASQKACIDEFARQTLDLLGYPERGLALISQYNIPLTISNQDKSAQIDACLVDEQNMILLILKGKMSLESNFSDPEPRVVAEAIAAYQYNNSMRELMGLETLDEMVFPCITMVGMRPTFYLVPVSRALSNAVRTGQYSHVRTEVRRCVTVAGRNRRISEGMGDPEYRRIALERFVAFRALAKTHWEDFLERRSIC